MADQTTVFDPDAYLAESAAPATAFDPDTYLGAPRLVLPEIAARQAPQESPEEFIQRTTPELVRPMPETSRLYQLTGFGTPSDVAALEARAKTGDRRAIEALQPTPSLAEQVAMGVQAPAIQKLAVRLPAIAAGATMGAEIGTPAGPLGTLAGAALGGMSGALGADPLAQAIQPETPGERIANIALAASPPAGQAATRLGQIGREALYGELLNQAFGETASLADTGRTRTLEEIKQSLGPGALIGGALGAILPTHGEAPRVTEKAPELIAPVAPPEVPKSAKILAEANETPSLANIATETGSQTPVSGIQTRLNQMISEPLPVPREVKQQQLEEAFGVNNPTRIAQAQEAFTQAAEQANRAAALTEQRIQSLVDQFSGGNDQVRTALLARRRNIPTEDFLNALEGEVQFRRNPLSQPDILAQRIQQEAEAAGNRPITAETPGVEMAGQIVPDEYAAIDAWLGRPEAPKESLAVEPGSLSINQPELTQPAILPEKPSIAERLAPGLPEEAAYVSGKIPFSVDQLIDRLESYKIHQPGMVAAGSPFSLAHDAALDFAILAIKSGRSIAEAIQMAVERFRRMHPDATPEETTRLVSSINESAGRPPITSDIDQIAKDRIAYEAIQQQMRGLERQHGIQVLDTPEYQAAWQTSENIKNRHGGMPPGEIAATIKGDTAYAPQIRNESFRDFSEYPGVSSRPDLSENFPQIRPAAGEQASGGGGLVEGPGILPGNIVREGALQEPLVERPFLTPIEPRTEVEQLKASAPPFTSSMRGRTPEQLENIRRASLLRRERGAISPALMSTVSGGVGGAAYGATKGDTPEQRLRNIILYGSLGLAGGKLAGSVLGKAMERPIRNYRSPVLKDIDQMLTAQEKERPSLLELVGNKYTEARYRWNTRFAPIGHAQRVLWKQAGEKFTPGRWYDLERGFERLAGAPVKAEAEVEQFQKIVNQLPKQNIPDLDTYLVAARIKDRLIKSDEENTFLLDRVGRAQAELESAQEALKQNPGVRNAGRVRSAQEELTSANTKLEENWNRKRVGDWSITKADKGLTDLQQEIGPDAYAKIVAAGQQFQDVMNHVLDVQVKSGRMSQDLVDRIRDSNDFYAPFKVLKYYENEEGFIKGGGANRIPSSESLAKKITGIDEDDVRLASPLETATEMAYKGRILAEKNIMLRRMAEETQHDPEGLFFRHLKTDERPRQGYESITYFEDGKPLRLEVSRAISDSLNGMDLKQTDMILGALRAGAVPFKLGATGASIPFNIINVGFRDPSRLLLLSRYGLRGPQDLSYLLYEWPKALWSSARGNLGEMFNVTPDALYDTYMRSGIGGGTIARQLTPESFSARLPNNMRLADTMVESGFGLKSPIKLAAILSNTLEETTKLLGLQRALRLERLDKLTPLERERRWDEIITELRNYSGSPDFSRMGVDMRALNILAPFINARWQQAVNDFARMNPLRHGNKKDAGVAWARLTAAVGLPVIGLALHNIADQKNREDYNKIPEREREQYFMIPLYLGPDGKPGIVDYGKGGYYFKNRDGEAIRGYYRMPKDGFPGLLSNTIEDFINQTAKENPDAIKGIAANFSDNFAQTMVPFGIQGNTLGERGMSAVGSLNPLIKLPLEELFNRSTFTGREIVPESQVKAPPEMQYRENTPEMYRKLTGAVPEASPEFLRSPLRLQHLTEGMTGSAIRQFAAPRLSEGNPAGESSPFLGRFYRSEYVEDSELRNKAQESEQQRSAERLTNQRIAQGLSEILDQQDTPEKRKAVLGAAAQAGMLNPESLKYLKEDREDAAAGLTAEDRMVKRSFTVTGGYLARYYLGKIANMTPQARAEYLRDQARKRMLTKEVIAQMQQLSAAPQPATAP